ncbi:EAL domain-containing protein [Cryobacterium sp. 1639]|uniref:putative bifunctional diguanylate cyclase/phosphodiesterase n=1 Tax=Cryobacterium inferilacus TaxID=2866629 RepID=UPI001C733746|nr:EAL domain-containing protein [Cryobacterium sp. 1639]MBX0300961.1 EAL domain-containing protein [Cryobacterium sp. 1639]
METIKATGIANRVAFGLLVAIALVFITSSALDVVFAGNAEHLIIAVVGVLAAAVLDVPRLRLGTVPHRSPVVGLPIVVVFALEPAFAAHISVGLVCLGVLLSVWVRTRRPEVGLYASGITGLGGMAFLAAHDLLHGLDAMSGVIAAGSAFAYVAVVILADGLRRRVHRPRLHLGPDQRDYTATRLLSVGAGYTVLCALIGSWTHPFFDARTDTLAVAVTLVPLLVAGFGAIVLLRATAMRLRLAGVVSGVIDLNATNHYTRVGGQTSPIIISPASSSASLDTVLLNAVSAAIGVESATIRHTPAGRSEIGAPVAIGTANGDTGNQYVVVRRDGMDVPFSSDDRRAIAALAHTADVVYTARESIGGLTIRANTDPLTGLPNYGAFQDALANINDHRDYSEALAVLFIDLDDFKRMNDRYGHQAGDEILSEIGRRLSAVIRPYDVVARVGGDEFVVILTRLSSLAEAKLLAEELMDATGEPLPVGGNVINPILSIGLAYSAHRETDVNQLLRDADRSMLAIKKSRRRGGPAHESSINISGHRSSQMNDIVARAIDEDLLELAFQPIVSLVTGQIWAFEALVRYTDPELGPLSPPSLVEKAKSLGRLDALTRQVALKAMAAAADFRLIEPSIVCMTVNVEAGQLLPQRMGTFVSELAERYPNISLCLELNERSVARVSTAVRAQADLLRDLGIMIALDDYGSQDSSVDALVRMPMDILKIDKSLVDDLDDVRQREVLTALQGFGDNLEYSMIVEGVENEAMAHHLTALGIRSAQGFHYGVPRSLEKTLARLEEFGAAAVLPVRAASELSL